MAVLCLQSKIRQRQINLAQLIIHYNTVFTVGQYYVCPEFNQLRQAEVQKVDTVNRIDLIIPVGSPLALVTHHTAKIIQTAIKKVILILVLHFDDEVTTVSILAKNVEYHHPAGKRFRHNLLIHKGDINHMVLSNQ